MTKHKDIVGWRAGPINQQIGKYLKELGDSKNDEARFNNIIERLRDLINELADRSRRLDDFTWRRPKS